VDSRSAAFLDVMIAIAVVGVLAFLAGLVVIHARRPQAAGARAAQVAGSPPAPGSPQWYGFIPALLLVIAAAAMLVWLISSGGRWVWGESVGDWQSDTRAIAFTAVMIALAAIGLIGMVVYTIAESSRRVPPRPIAQVPSADAAATAIATPSGMRLVGLLLLAVALLLMAWIALSRASQYALMLQLIYPASFGVALVLLFDKASRTWSTKAGAETFREWLLCDALTFLLVLGFLNLRGVEKADAYAGLFWDLANVMLLLAVFWVVDRKTARSRFLAAYAYFVVAPILLLIWRSMVGVAVPPDLSWWSSVWPFFILGTVFFCLEIVTLLAAGPTERHGLPAVKDAAFVLLYAILLIVSAGSGAHA